MIKINVISLLILIVFVFPQIAQGKGFVKGEGRFISKKGDSLTFIKSQLLYSASKDILTKELVSMGLDPAHFWEQYDSKFLASFAPKLENMLRPFGDDEEGKKRATLDDNFQRRLRHKKLILLEKFGGLKKILTSYLVKRMTRATGSNEVIYMSIMAKVNRKKLNRIYMKFTRVEEAKFYQKIYFTPVIELQGISWPEIGVEVISDFKNTTEVSWQRWLKDQFGDGGTQVIVTSLDKDITKISEFLKLPPVVSINTPDESSGEEIVISSSEFGRSLWIKAHFFINKSNYDKIFKQLDYNISGEMRVYDLDTKKIIHFQDIKKENRSVSAKNEESISSTVATTLFQFPLRQFKRLGKKLMTRHLPKEIDIFVEGHRNMRDIYKLQKILDQLGVTIQLSSQIKEYTANGTCLLQIGYLGPFERIKEMLNKVKMISLSNDLQVSFLESEDQKYSLSITKRFDEAGLESKGTEK